ncbi:hypothetical protein [Pelosinus sp. IPA-1]|uniref:hypothetical protein n=1 Tax=Pelosinus sp. IPA-1 TaxID=3029569 RepID=UPI00243623B0|nr:hypothetical protein [Pelosinus sp. IPA-1]GMA97696.1 hypothetical protein PIPA1_04960 [Pelosinus sp. IPA-1]
MEYGEAIETRIRIENEYRSGASWFYWIAGMSILNEIFIQTHTSWNFAIGLGITQICSAIFGSNVVSIVINLIISGIFLLFGKMAHRGHRWAFIVGMILYSFDGILFILVKDYVGLGLHVFALFYIYRGMKAYKQLITISNSQTLTASEEEEAFSNKI